MPFGVLHLVDHVVELVHFVHQLHRGFEVELFVAAELVAGAVRVQEVHLLRELAQLRFEFRIAELVAHQRLQLRALFGAQR